MIAHAKSDETDRCLPPGERAFEVYQLLEVERLSTRAAAERVGLSQTRVIQLRDAVEAWVGRPQGADAARTKQQRLQIAEYKAGLRLDHLYSLAVEAFRQSQGPEMVCEEAPGGIQTIKTRVSYGNTRYLAMAMRIAAQQSRIPATPIRIELDADVPSAPAEALAAEASPPEGDCSLAAAGAQKSSDPSAAAIEPSACEATTSAAARAKPNRADVAFAADFFPVQTKVLAADSQPLARAMLTRKQRKQRARRLAALRRE